MDYNDRQAIEGLFGMPTVINNVISLASVPIILDKGGAYYKDYGMGRSLGTLPIQRKGHLPTGLLCRHTNPSGARER